jgi:hypothetical protein
MPITLSVALTFTEELLGTASANPELYREFIASKRPEGVDEAEVEALPDVDDEVEKSTTCFHRDGDGNPILWDYQIKGFFKDACGMLRRADAGESRKLKAYKKQIDGLVFVKPRMIPLVLPEGADTGICERPLRAQTAQGERVALARSETAPAGTRCEFTVKLLDAKMADAVFEWFEYGEDRGLGQWRNSGKGRFTCETKVVTKG